MDRYAERSLRNIALAKKIPLSNISNVKHDLFCCYVVLHRNILIPDSKILQKMYYLIQNLKTKKNIVKKVVKPRVKLSLNNFLLVMSSFSFPCLVFYIRVNV